MTGLYARLMIDEALRSGKIDEDCANYFDSLIVKNNYIPSNSPYTLRPIDPTRKANLDEIFFNASLLDLNKRSFCCDHKISINADNEACWELLNFIKKDIDRFSYKIDDKTVYLENIIKYANPISYFSSATTLEYDYTEGDDKGLVYVYYYKDLDLNGIDITPYHIEIVETILDYIKNVEVSKEDYRGRIRWFENLLNRCKSEYIKNQLKEI